MRALLEIKVLVVLLMMVQMAFGVDVSLCSSENTASGSGSYDTYQSNGNCEDQCSSYAYGITQGNYCWCSNYTPGSTVSTSECNEECPGYPYEDCGSTSGLYGYIALANSPSGTVDATSSTAAQTTTKTSTSSQASVVEQTTSTQTSSSTTSSSSTIVTSSMSTSSTSTTTPAPSTLVVTTTASATSDSTSSSSISSSSSNSATQLVTSIVTIAGQTQVSTVVITPSSSSTSTASGSLGQGASNNPGNGLSKGKVAGLAVGIALGVTILASTALFFLWRRMKQRSSQAEAAAAALSPEMASGSSPGSVSRHTSQMSQSGLLGKSLTLNTRNLSSEAGGTSNISPGSGNRRSLGADQRLNANHPIYMNPYSNNSGVSLEDNADYSRKILSVRNADPSDLDE